MAAVVAALGLALLAAWGKGWKAVAAAPFLAVLCIVFVLGFTSLLSLPKPIVFEWFAGKGEVLSAYVVQNETIFVWVRVDGENFPRSYSFPWSEGKEQELYEAMVGGKEAGENPTMDFPYESSLDDREPKFYEPPQQANPPKVAQ